MRTLAHVAIVVNDYEEAIDYYINQLGFLLVEDTQLSETKRWVVVSPSIANGCSLLLAKAATEEQKNFIGNQSGGRVFLFLHTDDFWIYYNELKANQVIFVREPVEESYGTVAVFKDIYGNLWDLIQPRENTTTEQ